MKRIIFEYGDIDIIYIFYKTYVAVEHVEHATGKIISSRTTKDRIGIITHIANEAYNMEDQTAKMHIEGA